MVSRKASRRKFIAIGIGISIAGCMDSDQTNNGPQEGDENNGNQEEQPEDTEPDVIEGQDPSEFEQEIVDPDSGEVTDQFIEIYKRMYQLSEQALSQFNDAYEKYNGREFDSAIKNVESLKNTYTKVQEIYTKPRSQEIIELNIQATPRLGEYMDKFDTLLQQMQLGIDQIESAEEARQANNAELYREKLVDADSTMSYVRALLPPEPSRLR